MVILVLLYGSACYQLNVEEMKLLEGVQRNACKWIATDPNYKTLLQRLGILPLPMHIQLNNLLLLSKILNNHYDFTFSDRFPPKNDLANTRSRLFECTRPAKFVCEKNFWFHAKRLANLVPQKVDFTNTIGLKGGCCNGCGSISRKDSMTPTPVAGKFCATVPETTAEICLTNLTETVGETPCVR